MIQSRQYSFINNKLGLSISFLQGSGILDQVYKVHNIGPNAMEFYKNTILGSAQLVNFLKPGENLGFYIDSEDPYFRFKIELASNGTLRTLLLPEEFQEFPHKFSGKCRLHKIFTGRSPYTSILEYQNFEIKELPNDILDKSYQTNSKILFSQKSQNSIMVTKLPPTNINKKIEDFDDMSINIFEQKYSELITELFDYEPTSIDEIQKFMEKEEFSYLGSKEVSFYCPCSKERMINNLFTLSKEDRIEIFKEDKTIEIRCDYCNTIYNIEKEEVIGDLQ